MINSVITPIFKIYGLPVFYIRKNPTSKVEEYIVFNYMEEPFSYTDNEVEKCLYTIQFNVYCKLENLAKYTDEIKKLLIDNDFVINLASPSFYSEDVELYCIPLNLKYKK